MRLEFRRLPLGELDGVRSGRDECVDGTAEVFDPVQEVTLAEEAVIDGDVEAAAGGCVEEAVEAVTNIGHGGHLSFSRPSGGERGVVVGRHARSIQDPSSSLFPRFPYGPEIPARSRSSREG